MRHLYANWYHCLSAYIYHDVDITPLDLITLMPGRDTYIEPISNLYKYHYYYSLYAKDFQRKLLISSIPAPPHYISDIYIMTTVDRAVLVWYFDTATTAFIDARVNWDSISSAAACRPLPRHKNVPYIYTASSMLCAECSTFHHARLDWHWRARWGWWKYSVFTPRHI